MTPAQARKAVDRKLAAVYGHAWRSHTPSWSKPECRQPDRPQRYTCLVEFEHGGVWYSVSASVKRGKVKLYRPPVDHWVRRWSDEQSLCQADNFTIVGKVWGNSGGCHELTIRQNFGSSKGDPDRVRYTGFKKSVFHYGTGTALWPDFFLYKCSYAHETFQCLNRFGDGFRWMPNADPGATRFYARFDAGTVGCDLGSSNQLICEGFPQAVTKRRSCSSPRCNPTGPSRRAMRRSMIRNASRAACRPARRRSRPASR
jgi:hypothetical protein